MNTNYSEYDYPSQVDPDEIPDFADPPKIKLKQGRLRHE
jgi:hypothetical protein